MLHTPEVSVVRMVIAATNIEEMARFYALVFEAPMQPVQAHGATLYESSAGGVNFVLCPNSVAGVRAEQSRHQLAFRTPRLEQVLGQLRAAGPSVSVEGVAHEHFIVIDPDGNTLELVPA